MITRDDLHTLILGIVNVARNQIIPKLEADEDLAPCLFVADSEMNVIGVVQINLPDNYDERVRLDTVIRHRLYEMQASAYAFTMMGWMLEVSRDKASDKALEGIRPSEHPDKIETFIVTAGSNRDHLTRMYRVIRRRGKIATLEDRTPSSCRSEIGLFVDMLATRPKEVKLN